MWILVSWLESRLGTGHVQSLQPSSTKESTGRPLARWAFRTTQVAYRDFLLPVSTESCAAVLPSADVFSRMVCETTCGLPRFGLVVATNIVPGAAFRGLFGGCRVSPRTGWTPSTVMAVDRVATSELTKQPSSASPAPPSARLWRLPRFGAR